MLHFSFDQLANARLWKQWRELNSSFESAEAALNESYSKFILIMHQLIKDDKREHRNAMKNYWPVDIYLNDNNHHGLSHRYFLFNYWKAHALTLVGEMETLEDKLYAAAQKEKSDKRFVREIDERTERMEKRDNVRRKQEQQKRRERIEEISVYKPVELPEEIITVVEQKEDEPPRPPPYSLVHSHPSFFLDGAQRPSGALGCLIQKGIQQKKR